MAIIVEDGTGLADAESFASVAEADAYCTLRGLADWAALTTGAKEAALVNATEYLSDAFDWVGERLTDEQALAWPRTASYSGQRAPAGVPNKVKAAAIRVANLAGTAGATLFASVAAGDALRRVKAGSVEVEFADAAAQIAASGRDAMPWLVDMLAGLITAAPDAPSGNGMSFVSISRS